jgi:hypothetical protein
METTMRLTNGWLALVMTLARAGWSQETTRLVVDGANEEIVISVENISIAPATPYTHHTAESYHVISWPVTGWMRGYEVELLDSTGVALPRHMLHHAGMANVNRRQIAYPMAERIFAAAHETGAVTLPGRYGVPVSAGHQLALYFALVNPGSAPVTGAVLRVRLRWAPVESPVTGILPFYASAKADTRESISFDIPEGRSETSGEFTLPSGGWLRALGGHLHDHGVELRLEDAGSNKVLARIRAHRDSAGALLSIERTRFALKGKGLRLRANRRYRVVAVYDNRTGHVITGGAMGFLAGAFIPENLSAFEHAAASDPRFEADVARLTSRAPASVAHGAHGAHGPHER